MDPNFVIVKFPDPLALLVETFPQAESLLEEADQGAFHVYARFAEYLAAHTDDKQLWDRAYSFFETLAGGNSMMEELLVELLEDLSAGDTLKQKLAHRLGPKARGFL